MEELRRRTGVVFACDGVCLSWLERGVAAVGLRLAGSVSDEVKALAVVRDCRPDLFLVSLDGDRSAAEGLGLVCKASLVAPAMRTVVVSASQDPRLIAAAFGVGAAAYASTAAEMIDLASAIRQVFKRSVHFAGSPEPARPSVELKREAARLTRRECEILGLVARGLTNGGVARKLWVTEQTVKFHLSNIYRKLSVANRTEASRWAHEHRLLEATVTEPERANGRLQQLAPGL